MEESGEGTTNFLFLVSPVKFAQKSFNVLIGEGVAAWFKTHSYLQ